MPGKARDSDKLKAQLGIQFTGIEAEIKKLAPFMSKLGKTMPLEIRKGLKQVNKDVVHIGALLKSATDPDTLETLKVAMANVAKEAQKVGEGMSRAAAASGKTFQVANIDKTTQSLQKMNVALKQSQQQQMRTTLMSQNMLRVMQDSPFGMLGMANNIQQLGENLAFAQSKGTSFTKAMGAGLKNLLMGPMAFATLITVGTLVAQKWDVIVEAGKKFADMLDGVAEKQRDFNAAQREFSSADSFEKWADSLPIADVKKAQEAVEQYIAALGDPEEAARVVERGAGIKFGILKGLGGEGTREDINTAKALLELHKKAGDRLHALELAEQQITLKNLRDTNHGIESEKAKAERRQKEKDDNARRKRLTLEAKSINESMLLRLGGYDQRLKDAEEAQKDLTAAELKAVKARNSEKLKLRREFLQDARKMTSELAGGIHMADLEATAIGVGAARRPAFDATPSQRVASEEARTAGRNAAIQASIAARQKARVQLDIWMQAADANSDMEELKRLTIKHDKLLAQEGVFTAAIKRNEVELAAWKREQKAREQQREMAALGGFVSEIGGMFGGMADIMATAGEKGLEQNKSMLKAQAWAQAIAASIGIFNNVANTPGLGPFALAAAGAAMASTMVTLAAQIKKIDNPGGGAATGISGGAFTALNSNVTAQRASNFQRSEDRRNATGAQGAAASASNTEELLSNINEGIRTQKVVVDQSTIATMELSGKATNTRRVQTSD